MRNATSILLVVVAAATASLSLARPAAARSGTSHWVAHSTGASDRAVAVVNDGTNTWALFSYDAVKLGEVRQYNFGGVLRSTITIGGLTQPLFQALVVSGGTVYVAGQAAGSPFLNAYSASTGQLLWARTVGGSGGFQRLAATDAGVVAAGSIGQRLYVAAFTSAGAVPWTYQAPASSGASALAFGNGRVVVGGFPNFLVRVMTASSGALQFENAESPATGLGQVFDLVVSGDRAYAAGQGPAGSPFTRAFDLVARTRLWSTATATWFGSARAVALNAAAGVVVTTGSVAPSTTDMYVEALDAASGVRRWLDVYNPASFDLGTAITTAGNRVYAVGSSTRANNDQDFVVRAYGVTDGYLHWNVLSSETGNASAAGVTTDSARIFVAGQEPVPGFPSQAFVRQYDAFTIGGTERMEKLCPRHGSNAAKVVEVATLPRRAFVACSEVGPIGGTATVPATLIAYELPSGNELWRDDVSAGLPAGAKVLELRVAATAGQVVAVATVQMPTSPHQFRVRFYDQNPQSGTTSTPWLLWSDTISNASLPGFTGRVAARDGFVLASGVSAGVLGVRRYDLRSCRSNCPQWTATFQQAGPMAIDVGFNRGAVAYADNGILSTIVFDNLGASLPTPIIYTSGTAPHGDGNVHDVALGSGGVFTVGTGQRGPHTYYAARYTLGTTSPVAWFDDRPLAGSQTEDGWGVALGGTRVFGCGYAIVGGVNRHVIRAYDPAAVPLPPRLPGQPLWEAAPTLWSGTGLCAEMTATATRAFVVGSDSADGFNGAPLVASFDAASGREDWIDRSLPATGCATGASDCSIRAAVIEGEQLVTGGQSGADGRARIYSAACTLHGVESPCR